LICAEHERTNRNQSRQCRSAPVTCGLLQHTSPASTLYETAGRDAAEPNRAITQYFSWVHAVHTKHVLLSR
jgi:hypothetical protein